MRHFYTPVYLNLLSHYNEFIKRKFFKYVCTAHLFGVIIKFNKRCLLKKSNIFLLLKTTELTQKLKPNCESKVSKDLSQLFSVQT
jgi:hypothetical protein